MKWRDNGDGETLGIALHLLSEKWRKGEKKGEGGAKQANKIPPIVHSLSVVMKQKTGLALVKTC